MKTLQVFETMTGEWCAGTTSLDSVWADTKENALKMWREKNPKKRVKTKEV